MGNVESKRLVFNVGLFSATAAALAYIWLGNKPPPRRTIPSSTVIWEPTIQSQGNLRGYYNLGNSCYINSLLQALAASRHNVRYINNYFELKQRCCKGDDNHADFQIVSALAASNQYINCDVGEMPAELSRQIPENVITTFKNWSQVSLATHQEQDVHEFFNTIMGALFEQQKTLQARPDFMEVAKSVEDSTLSFSYRYRVSDCEPSSLPDSGVSSLTTDDLDAGLGIANLLSKSAMGTHIVTKGSMLEVPKCPRTPTNLIDWNNPFVGRFASSFECICCQSTLPIKFEDFADLTLMLPSKVAPTLNDLIEHYFVPAMVHSVDCANCSNVMEKPTKSTFYKRTCISKFPRSLCIHVNRAEWGKNGCSSKRFDFISFPLELDMSVASTFTDLMKMKPMRDLDLTGPSGEPCVIQFKEDKAPPPPVFHRTPILYKLMAVVCHRGSVDTGHFVAYRLSPSKMPGCEEAWYLVSDTFIKEVPKEQVLLQHAYMLFYDRIETA